MKLKHFEKTVVGLVRKANEDSIGSLTKDKTNGYGEVFVVCDGMGGHVGGAIASKTAVDCILQYFEGSPSSNPIIALEKSISFANMQIYAKAMHDVSLKGMGTTCTVLLNKGDNIYIAHVGDSRIYLNTDNKLYRLTKDHSFVQSLVDAGQLEDSEMEKHPRKNELTRALGISQDVDVEIAENPISSKNGDTFLMCSDGLCGLVNDATIANTMRTTADGQTVNDLIELAENAGGNDNISVTIINVVESPHKTTKFKDQANRSLDLSATQVLDVSSMNLDTKTDKGYKKYILGILFVIILFIGKKSYDKFTNNDNVKPELDQNYENKEIKSPEEIQKTSSKKSQVEEISTAKEAADKKAAADRKAAAKKELDRKAAEDRKATADKKAAAKKKTEFEKKSSFEDVINKIKEILKGQDQLKGTPEFITLSKTEKALEENMAQEQWNKIDSLGEIAKKQIEIFKVVISSKVDQSEAQNEEESNEVKQPINKQALIDQGYIEEKYKWDLTDCSEKEEIEGEKFVYRYTEDQKEIHALFEKEESRKRDLIKNGYGLITKTISDSIPREEREILYDDLNEPEKNLANKLKKCSNNEYGKKEYYSKSPQIIK